ncbi:hypothetical protein AB0L81_29400, partial [Streptomyces sp. NPDC052127]
MSDRLPKLPTSHLVRDLATMDQALYETVTVTRTPTLDSALRRLSAAADHSKLSFGDLVQGRAAGHQVQHGQPVDDDEVLADRLAHP